MFSCLVTSVTYSFWVPVSKRFLPFLFFICHFLLPFRFPWFLVDYDGSFSTIVNGLLTTTPLTLGIGLIFFVENKELPRGSSYDDTQNEMPVSPAYDRHNLCYLQIQNCTGFCVMIAFINAAAIGGLMPYVRTLLGWNLSYFYTLV